MFGHEPCHHWFNLSKCFGFTRHSCATVSLFFTTMLQSYKTILSVCDHCMTCWGVQGCLYSYWQQQIGQSDCDITANCGKMYNTAFNFMP